MQIVKIYGERNSGTIYLEWLLHYNYKIEVAKTPDLGWKHRIAPLEDELPKKHARETIFLFLVKNPYSWLLSMHKRPYHHEELRELTFSQFLKYSYGDYQNPIVMWNKKYSSYLEMKNYVDNSMFIHYEDLLKNYKNTLKLFASNFELENPVIFKNISNRLTNTHGIKNRKFPREHYLEEKWKKSLKSKHIDFINKYLDKSLMNYFNYTVL